MSRVEADSLIVDRMHNDRPNAGDLRSSGTAAECVGQQISSETQPLEAGSDCKARYQKQRHLVGHALAQLCGWQGGSLLHGGRNRIITDNLPGPLGIADHIGSSRSALAGKRPLDEPLVERGMTSVIESGDLVIGVQTSRRRNTAREHGNRQCVRSSIPERLALHQLFKGWRGRGRRIEQGQKLLMALRIEKESALIEDRGLSLSPRAREHELGQFLTTQRSGTAEHCLKLGCGPDLDDIILAHRSASVGTGVLCHVAELLRAIWRNATTMSIQSACQHPRLPFVPLVLTAFTAVSSAANASGPPPAAEPAKQGYWWYAPAPQPAPQTSADEAPVERPAIPPIAQLATWSPVRIRKLIEAQRDYAATVLTVDAVADFWRLEDFARRKARAFAGVTQLAMLEHPELNSKSANPMVGDARDQLLAVKDDTRRVYLRAHANEFALVMFSRTSCGYCRVEWPIVQRFRDEMGWQVTLMDLDQRPDLKERFGIDVTPTTMIIRRNSQQRLVIAAGVEAYPNLAQMAYQAVRLLTGDIRPEQFMTGAGEEGGFFDALSQGPVAASDPATSEPLDQSRKDRP